MAPSTPWQTVALYEAAQAVVAYLLNQSPSLLELRIEATEVPGDLRAAGHVRLPDAPEICSRDYCLDRLATLLAGDAAESILSGRTELNLEGGILGRDYRQDGKNTALARAYQWLARLQPPLSSKKRRRQALEREWLRARDLLITHVKTVQRIAAAGLEKIEAQRGPDGVLPPCTITIDGPELETLCLGKISI